MEKACIYSDKAILEHITSGNIIIEPFFREHLNNCSYNVTLSKYFFREKNVGVPYFNPWSSQHACNKWIPGEVKVATTDDQDALALTLGTEYITIDPFETILVATHEFIGTYNHVVAELKTRSSSCRLQLHISGWGDVGYIGRWCQQITNVSRFSTMVLPVGCSVAQIIFHPCDKPSKDYNGHYSIGSDLATIIDSWKPAMMLPRLHHPLNVVKGDTASVTKPFRRGGNITMEECPDDAWD